VIRYALLGLVQGVTEFLPISSSGHLLLVERLLSMDPPGVLLEAFLHWGTLAAVLISFRGDIADLARGFTSKGSLAHRKEVGLILAGTVPIVVAGILLRDRIDALFSSLAGVIGGLLVTGVLLMVATFVRRRVQRQQASFSDALVVGLAQASALVPGLSRSGATISAGMLSGLIPRRAARFSFLLSIPALLGAGMVSLWDVWRSGIEAEIAWTGILIGSAVAFLVGLITIKVLLRIVATGRLWGFGLYCFALAGLTWALLV